MANLQKLLLVDDEEEITELYGFFLRSKGYQVYEANSVKSAMKLIQNHGPFDLLISDIRMPGEEGTRLGKAMNDVPVLFITGYTDFKISPDLAPANYEIMSKPVDTDEFLSKIESILNS